MATAGNPLAALLTCPICENAFGRPDNRPVLCTACGKSICKLCFDSMARAARHQCPFCRQPLHHPPVYNRTVEDMMDAMLQATPDGTAAAAQPQPLPNEAPNAAPPRLHMTHPECSRGHGMQRLTQNPPNYGGAAACDRCRRPRILAAHGALWHCPLCEYDLCLHCTGEHADAAPASSVLGRLAGRGDPPQCRGGHRMRHITERPEHYGGAPRCDECRDDDICYQAGGSWHCPACSYDLCLACTRRAAVSSGVLNVLRPAGPGGASNPPGDGEMPPMSRLVRCPAGHPMGRSEENPEGYGGDATCDKCRRTSVVRRDGSVYHCHACSFDYCLQCSEDPWRPVSAVRCRAGHEMTRTVGRRLEDAGFKVCCQCQDTHLQAGPRPYWSCERCEQDVCLKCAAQRDALGDGARML